MSEHVLEHLSAYIDGALGAAEKERFRAHLAECSSCTKRLEELAGVDSALRDLPSGAPEGYFEGLPSRVRSRLAASAAPRRRLWRAPVWTLAAAAAVLVAVIAPLTLQKRASAPDAFSARLEDQPAAPAASEMDKLEVAKRADAAPPATVAAAPTPAASAAPSEDYRRREQGKSRDLAKKAQAAPSYTEEVVAARPPAAPPPPAAAPVAGFAVPPRQAEQSAQMSGPRANQQAEQRKQDAMKQTADAQAEAPDASGRRAVRAMETKDAAAPAEGAKSEKETVPGRTGALTAASRPLSRARFRELQARAPKDASEARTLRESWRRFSVEADDAGQADEARVRVIAMGVEAWRFERRPEDKSLAERDADAYVKRADARQPARVRELLLLLSR